MAKNPSNGSQIITECEQYVVESTSEDPATGSAAGCTAAWKVRYGIAKPDEVVHILQGVEIKRPSHIFVRASKDADRVKNVRVGGHAVQIYGRDSFPLTKEIRRSRKEWWAEARAKRKYGMLRIRTYKRGIGELPWEHTSNVCPERKVLDCFYPKSD